MEEPIEEYWDVEDYSQPYDESDGKLGWIWRKGLSIGKKVVVTGVVISSAPFVLPPLVALSTIGAAVSVPAGFVIITCLCTDKLLNCLLPMPLSPHLPENETISFDEAEYKFYEDHDVDKGYQKDMDFETEEKEFEEDTKKRVEMMLNVAEEYGDDVDKGYEKDEDVETEEKESEEDTKKGVEDGDDVDRGYKKDEDVETEEKESEEDTKKGVEDGDYDDKGYKKTEDGKTKEKDSEEGTNKGMEMRFDLVEAGNYEIDYGLMPLCREEVDRRKRVNEIVEEAYEEDVDERIDTRKKPFDADAVTEILEGIRQAEDEIAFFEGEGNDEMPTTGSLQGVVVSAEVGGEKDDSVENILEELVFLGPRHMKEENGHADKFTEVSEDEMRRETTRLLEKMRDAGTDQEKMQENEKKVEIVMNEYENKGNKKLGKDVTEMDQKFSGGELLGEGESLAMEAETKPVVAEQKLVVHVQTPDDHTTTDLHQGKGSDRKTRTLAFSNADDRETPGESGFDLFERGNPPYQTSESADKQSKGKGQTSENVVDVNVEYHELLIESTIPVVKTAHTKLNQDSAATSNKVSINEEAIWDQIHAVRTIVGYKVTPHTSCVEELKALFIFTGVEPPILSKDPADLVDMNEKLHFLMSVIGVK